ncbi:hypothetical protein [Pedobacter nyackensis]|uniref:Uncharacterized protein n=1 Tax=Pedobacter nyackensis TaxID=475255 RepID=A0A1W1ZY00_9SPHI|nr:hypothetical protein [Pedobacter nyackensis]SMC53280.1 hypothetical protein SAMN04488101_101144 [Pedobacter nyackensis]
MEEKFILKSITDTLTGKKVHQITVPIRVVDQPTYIRSFWDKVLFRKGIMVEPETSRTFEIWPCVVKNMYRVAGNAALLVDSLHDDHSENIKLVNDNMPIVAHIVAAAIQNNKFEPAPELIEFLEDNIDADDMYTALQAAFDNAGMQSFSNSIVLMKGTETILKTKASPNDGSELIASHIATLDQSANTLDGLQTQ